jgi:hypothetical protein
MKSIFSVCFVSRCKGTLLLPFRLNGFTTTFKATVDRHLKGKQTKVKGNFAFQKSNANSLRQTSAVKPFLLKKDD